MSRPYCNDIESILKEMNSSENGLSSTDANDRLRKYGKNILKEEKINKFKIFIVQFKNIMIYVLLIASIISAFAQKWIDFFAINFLVLLNSFIGFFQEIKAHISIQELKNLTQIPYFFY